MAIHCRWLSVIISVVICTNDRDVAPFSGKKRVDGFSQLVYSVMILRLRSGYLHWQHSENADGRRKSKREVQRTEERKVWKRELLAALRQGNDRGVAERTAK